MSEKMRNCKACGQQIAKSAKSCPHCGAKVKKVFPAVLCALVLVIVIVAVASSGNDEPKLVEGNSANSTVTGNVNEKETTAKQENNTPTEKETTPKQDKNTFNVGETAELKNIAVSMVRVTQSSGSQFNTPKDGNVFVLCEFEIANNSSSEIAISSMLSFNGYCDDYACSYSLSALLEKGEKNQLDGTVAPGKKMNGVIGYEVPADWKELEVHFTPDFLSGKDIIFVGTNN